MSAQTWVIDLPWESPPVKPNGGHGHWAKNAQAVRRTRADMGKLARHHKIPRLQHATVRLVWHVGDRRKRDEDNLVWMLKPLCDAISESTRPRPFDWPIVPDDGPSFMTKHMPRIEYVKGQQKRMTLTIEGTPA